MCIMNEQHADQDHEQKSCCTDTREPDAKANHAEPAKQDAPLVRRLWPLVLIVVYLVVVPGLVAVFSGAWDVTTHMRHFMGGFFVAFSFFKLLDLRGFVDAYRGYDVVAGAVPAYAWAYPFVELVLGVLYLAGRFPTVLNAVVLVLMLVGIVGVVRALFRPEQIRCACLGTVLDLPMTRVTFIENASMALMAGYMLYRAASG